MQVTIFTQGMLACILVSVRMTLSIQCNGWCLLVILRPEESRHLLCLILHCHTHSAVCMTKEMTNANMHESSPDE